VGQLRQRVHLSLAGKFGLLSHTREVVQLG
jgi:hypothetical protein